MASLYSHPILVGSLWKLATSTKLPSGHVRHGMATFKYSKTHTLVQTLSAMATKTFCAGFEDAGWGTNKNFCVPKLQLICSFTEAG